MVKTSELRIGNLVCDRDSPAMRVIGVFRDQIIAEIAEGLPDWEIEERDIVGVPISESLLIEMGFEKRQTGLKEFGDCWYIDLEYMTYCLMVYPCGNEQKCKGTLCRYNQKTEAYSPTEDDNEKMVVVPEQASAFAWGITSMHRLQNLIFDLKEQADESQ